MLCDAYTMGMVQLGEVEFVKPWLSVYRLMNDQFSRWFNLNLTICTVMLNATNILVRMEVSDYTSFTAHERFEDLYTSSGSIWVYVVAVMIACGFFIYTIYSDYWGSKAIYTYMTLPVRREAIYASKLIAFMLSLIFITAFQLISIRVGHSIYAHHIDRYADGMYLMNNGLFLAVIRSSFMRLILPLSWIGFMCTLTILLVLSTGIYYAVLCERADRRYGAIVSAVAGIALFDLVRQVTREDVLDISLVRLIFVCVLLLSLSGYFIIHSIYLVRRGANV